MAQNFSQIRSVRTALREVNKEGSKENEVSRLTNALLNFYFPLQSDWLIGSEQRQLGGVPDYVVYKDYYEDTPPLNHVLVECKKMGEPVISSMNQVTLVAERLLDYDKTFVILVLGKYICFFEYYNPSRYTVTTPLNTHVFGDYLNDNFNGLFPIAPMEMSLQEVAAIPDVYLKEWDNVGGYLVCVWNLCLPHHTVHIDNIFRYMPSNTPNNTDIRSDDS